MERCQCQPIIRRFLTPVALQRGIPRVFGEGKETGMGGLKHAHRIAARFVCVKMLPCLTMAAHRLT
jgi:hypothetical protein